MKKQKLLLYKVGGYFRTVIKTRHGRLIYLEVNLVGDRYEIMECYYVDRIRSSKYYVTPKKWQTKECEYDHLLEIIANELDRKYFGIEIVNFYEELSIEEFIQRRLSEYRRGYKFLIFVGAGNTINGIPATIKTRFKNRIHRSIYLELQYHGDGKGVVSDCYYYDRKYKARKYVMPEMLTSILFEYSREAIINMVNNELNTDFTDIIFITDDSVDIGKEIPLCGNI